MYLSQLSLFRQDRLHALTDRQLILDRNIQTTEPAGMDRLADLCYCDQMVLLDLTSIGGPVLDRGRFV